MTNADITLYAIADPNRARGGSLAELARRAVTGGATLVQYRNKTGTTRAMVEEARDIKAALAGTGVPLIVNDRVDVALAVGAAGVHIGQEDMHPTDARRLLGDSAVIGLSVKTEAEARAAPVELLDHVFVGAVFETTAKDNPAPIGVEGWRRLAAILRERKPGFTVGAIAGISAGNAGPLIAAGADGVSAIAAMFMADDVEAAARELRGVVDAARREQAA
ncbi:MAG TPA: thiamine phosphate synthase [Afifellaceae bacterium]|nr:thiamine phosphate synthase [Afifellaceae bacterium]